MIAAIVNALVPPVELPAVLEIERVVWADVEARVEDLEALRVEVKRPPEYSVRRR